MRISPRVVAALLAALAVAAGCRDGASPARPGAAARRYTVRGEVVRVSTDAPAPELSIRHEAIPDFADRSGATVGMAAMVMPFSVARDVPLGGLAPGDKIRFRFAMDWSANRMEIEAVEELPPETPLDFGAGRR